MLKAKCRKNIIWSFLLAAIFIGGCGPTLKVNPPVFQKPVCQEPPQVDSLVLRETPPTVTIIDGAEYWVFTTEEYQALAQNLQDILALVRQQKAVGAYYQKCLADNTAKPPE